MSGRGGATRPRPVRAAGPLLGSGVILAAWEAVAHNSGAGWVQALGTVVGAVLLVGLGGPALALARTRLTVVAAPLDATAGSPVALQLSASTRVQIRPVDPPGQTTLAGPVTGDTRPAGAGQLTVVFPTRQVASRVVVEVSSAAPFGLLWWRRRQLLALPAALHVGPRLGPADPLPAVLDPVAGDSRRRLPAPVGEPRGVRDYQPGDSRRFVHWPATAHHGRLLVRAMEGPSAQPVTVRVPLPADPAGAEAVAERAAGTVAALLQRAVPVELVTDEPAGVVRASVSDRRGTARRLARAVAADRATDHGLRPDGGVVLQVAGAEAAAADHRREAAP